MQPTTPTSLRTRFLISLLLVTATFAVMFVFFPASHSDTQPRRVATGAQIHTKFSLVDMHGAPITEQDVLGKPHMVFFGFTHCPDICPLGVSNMFEAMKLLEDHAKDVRVLFITIDPTRDDVTALRNYTAPFQPYITGLTGSQAQIDEAVDSFKVFASVLPENKDYQVSHSGYIYIMDAKGALIEYLQHDAEPKQIADALHRAVDEHEHHSDTKE